MLPQGPELLVVIVVVLLLFGGSQLPKLARSVGRAQTEFRHGLREGAVDEDPGDQGTGRHTADPEPSPTRRD